VSERLRSLMVAHGALVFLLGMAAGFPFAFVILGKIVLWPFPGAAAWNGPGDLRGWRMAHLEGILNGLLLFAVAAVAPRVSLGARAQRIVGWSLIVTAWGNMIASLVGPLFGGRGLEFGDGFANGLMYVLFVIAVVAVIVAMVLIAAGGFRRARDAVR
jgi:hypothetical protein